MQPKEALMNAKAAIPVLDLETFTTIREALIVALQSQRILWEQSKDDAVAEDRPYLANHIEQWLYGMDRALEIVNSESGFLLLRSPFPEVKTLAEVS
jgi:hypothetical protein